MRRWVLAILVAVMAVCAAAGCGGDAGAKAKSEMTITVTSRGYPEDQLLREIYAGALEEAGFKVERRGYEQSPSKEVEEGRVSGYPDHLDTALIDENPRELKDVPGSAEKAYEEVKARFEPKGLVAFPVAPFARSTAVVVPKWTAESRGLEGISDLRGTARGMTVTGEALCHLEEDCLAGLEHRYGIAFKAFSATEASTLDFKTFRAYKAVKEGKADAAVVYATEGEIARNGWLAVLEDDQRRLPAADAFWMTSKKVVDEAGPDYERAILAAQKGLTLQTMRKLNAEVELEGKPPSEVAARYLRSR